MIYVIDHKDSFTHNVVHQLSLFDKVKCTNYDEINNQYLKRASTIILSPGPGSPKDYTITSHIYNNYKGIVVISGEGVKEYYKKKGYKEKDTYMYKELINYIDILSDIFLWLLIFLLFYNNINLL